MNQTETKTATPLDALKQMATDPDELALRFNELLAVRAALDLIKSIRVDEATHIGYAISGNVSTATLRTLGLVAQPRLCPYHQDSLDWDACTEDFEGCDVQTVKEDRKAK